MVNMTHSTNGDGVRGLLKRIESLSSQKVAVGIPASESKRADSEIDNADLVYIHTHGVRPKAMREEMQPEINKGTPYSTVLQMYIHEHGSINYQVPPRPIIEPAIENAKSDMAELLGRTAKTAAEDGDIKQSLTDVGQEARDDVREWFTNPKNGWAPNAPSTLAKKRLHSDKPLIDTGALRTAIVYVIQEDNDD